MAKNHNKNEIENPPPVPTHKRIEDRISFKIKQAADQLTRQIDSVEKNIQSTDQQAEHIKNALQHTYKQTLSYLRQFKEAIEDHETRLRNAANEQDVHDISNELLRRITSLAHAQIQCGHEVDDIKDVLKELAGRDEMAAISQQLYRSLNERHEQVVNRIRAYNDALVSRLDQECMRRRELEYRSKQLEGRTIDIDSRTTKEITAIQAVLAKKKRTVFHIIGDFFRHRAPLKVLGGAAAALALVIFSGAHNTNETEQRSNTSIASKTEIEKKGNTTILSEEKIECSYYDPEKLGRTCVPFKGTGTNQKYKGWCMLTCNGRKAIGDYVAKPKNNNSWYLASIRFGQT